MVTLNLGLPSSSSKTLGDCTQKKTMSPTDLPNVAITYMEERSLGDRSKTTSFNEQNRRISSQKKSEKSMKVVPVAVVTIANLPQPPVQNTMPFTVDHSISFAAAAESCQGGMTEATMDQEGSQKDKTPDRPAEQQAAEMIHNNENTTSALADGGNIFNFQTNVP